MRHRKHTSKLNRTTEHRKALLRNLSIALVLHERIRTTQAKAQQLRPFLEKLITLAKDGTLAARRLAISRVGDRTTVTKLFDEIAPRVATRDGGYLRIVKDAPRMGDGALMTFVEFVDLPETGGDDETPVAKKKTLKQRLHERRKEMAKNR
jgi:large subunit ribosomal protein L17